MRVLASIFGIVAILVGFVLSFMAYQATGVLRLGLSPSAVQVTQVYSEASFYGIMAAVAFLFAIVVSLGAISSQIAELSNAQKYKSSPSELNTPKLSNLGKL